MIYPYGCGSSNYCKKVTTKELAKIDRELCLIEKWIIMYFNAMKDINESINKSIKDKTTLFWHNKNRYESLIERQIRIETLALVLYPDYNCARINENSLQSFLNNKSNVVKIIYYNIDKNKEDYLEFRIDENKTNN